MEDAASSLVPGYRLDRYELLCPIASGGMASVWLARLRGKRGFEKLFAVKTIKTELISDPHFQEMFLDEARIASRIIHPNVAQILELGEQDDILYLIMEFVDGDSVAKVTRFANKCGAPLPPAIAMRIVADTCAGLHAAHQLKDKDGELLGVVHRDVSPQNILLSDEGTAKIIDFGLVKAKNRGAGETQSGVVKGKIRYMAPEQVGQRAIDHRADVWALGMCLLELVTGKMPYHERDDLEVVQKLTGSSPIPDIDAPLPGPIEAIIARALVPEPAARYESAAAMKKAIEAAIKDLGYAAENDDVATWLRATLPELSQKRKATIAKAVSAAESRVQHAESLEGLGPADLALAQTEVSANKAPPSDEALPLTRRRGAEDSGPSDISSFGRTTSATRLMDELGERKRRPSGVLWIAGTVAALIGGYILWPRQGAGVDPTSTAGGAVGDAAALVPSAAASAEPAPIASAASSPDLDLPDDDTPPPAASATTSSPLPPLPKTTATSVTVASAPLPTTLIAFDAGPPGLSPGAQSAARVMLAPKTTEDAPPPPPPPPQAPPPPKPE